jgi:hypothetical protein
MVSGVLFPLAVGFWQLVLRNAEYIGTVGRLFAGRSRDPLYNSENIIVNESISSGCSVHMDKGIITVNKGDCSAIWRPQPTTCWLDHMYLIESTEGTGLKSKYRQIPWIGLIVVAERLNLCPDR